MNRNQAKKFYPILQAFAEGEAIECRTKPSALSKSWQDMNDWTEMKEIEFWNNTEYRIKPEPKYRPFKNAEECWAEMQKHQPFGWTKLIGAIEYSFITDVDDNTNYSGAIKEYTFADGTPFGIREEEQLWQHIEQQICIVKARLLKGIHYDSWDEPILAYRVDKRHSLLFGLIHYWEYGANNLFPVCSFYSVNEAEEAILKAENFPIKSKKVTILYK